MTRPASMLALLALCAASPAPSQRRAVLDALRPAIEKKLGRDVEFVVQVLRVEDGWAFVMADPRRKGGKPIDGNRIFGDDFENMDGLRVDALLQLRSGRWRVVDHAIGATDVWYCDIGPKRLKRGYGC
ncbi:MAG: hypothetical protein HOP96_00035 [Sphingomonas sp.]|nr:hypothetical protein [Sphingomonas sp.]